MGNVVPEAIQSAGRENAAAGVDPKVIGIFKDLMVGVSKRTRHLAEKKGFHIISVPHAHAALFKYIGDENPVFGQTLEGLGNKAWIAEMCLHLGIPDPTGQFHYGGIGLDAVRMSTNDVWAHNIKPAVVVDEVAAHDSNWFATPQANALARSIERACEISGCAVAQGESPAYKYLMKPEPPVKWAPSLSVCSIGDSQRIITGQGVEPGDAIIGWLSSGLHSNGISAVIRRVMEQKDGFATKLNGHTVGQEALIPTRSYGGLVRAILQAGIRPKAFWPITGGGVGKMATDDRFHYRILEWPALIPPLFRYMEELGVSKQGLLETFNMGIGYTGIFSPKDVDYVLEVGRKTQIDGEEGTYEPMVLGVVEEGQPGTYFGPWSIELPPPTD